MKFSNHKRRQAPTIIIISLIDILIVLLIFLMVTTTFKQQPSLKLVLPETKQARKGSSEDSHNVVVTVAKQEPYFYFGSAKRAITSDRLKEELAASVAKDPQISVLIWPDSEAPVNQFFKALDVATDAVGIKNVRVAAKKPAEK
jgi:biopolymer transport protein ExbD